MQLQGLELRIAYFQGKCITIFPDSNICCIRFARKDEIMLLPLWLILLNVCFKGKGLGTPMVTGHATTMEGISENGGTERRLYQVGNSPAGQAGLIRSVRLTGSHLI